MFDFLSPIVPEIIPNLIIDLVIGVLTVGADVAVGGVQNTIDATEHAIHLEADKALLVFGDSLETATKDRLDAVEAYFETLK